MVEPPKPPKPVLDESHPPVEARKKKTPILAMLASKFSTKNMYDSLGALPEDEPKTDGLVEKPVSSSSAIKPGKHADVAERLKTMDLSKSSVSPKGQAKEVLDWNDELWVQYGNKMRVFGTVEEVFVLDPASSAPPADLSAASTQ